MPKLNLVIVSNGCFFWCLSFAVFLISSLISQIWNTKKFCRLSILSAKAEKAFFWTITYIFLNRRRKTFIFTCFIILIVVKIITFILWSFVGVFNKFLIKSVVTKSVDFIFQICSRQFTTLIFFPQKIQYSFSGCFVFTFSWMWWILSVNCDISNFKQRLYFKYIKFKAISNRIYNNFFQ